MVEVNGPSQRDPTTPVRVEDPTVIDNRELRSVDREWKRGGFFLVSSLIGAFLADTLYVLWDYRALLGAGGSRASFGAWIFVVALLAVIAFGCVGLPRLLPGAERVTLDPLGVRLDYRDGRVELLRWESEGGVVLTDYTGVDSMVARGRTFVLRGPRYWSRRTLLPPQTARSILAYAELQGARSRRRALSAGPSGAEVVAYRLGPIQSGWTVERSRAWGRRP